MVARSPVGPAATGLYPLVCRLPERGRRAGGSRSVEVDEVVLVLLETGPQELRATNFVHRLVHTVMHRLTCMNTL